MGRKRRRARSDAYARGRAEVAKAFKDQHERDQQRIDKLVAALRTATGTPWLWADDDTDDTDDTDDPASLSEEATVSITAGALRALLERANAEGRAEERAAVVAGARKGATHLRGVVQCSAEALRESGDIAVRVLRSGDTLAADPDPEQERLRQRVGQLEVENTELQRLWEDRCARVTKVEANLLEHQKALTEARKDAEFARKRYNQERIDNHEARRAPELIAKMISEGWGPFDENWKTEILEALEREEWKPQ